MNNRMEFSKWLLVIDYAFMILFVILSIFNFQMVELAIAWIVQLSVSTGFYYWKAKNENRIKIPVEILRSLDEDERTHLDLTQVITTCIDKE